MQKILLYYKFAPIADPQAVMLWQKALCQTLNLRGRIIVSEHGINGTVGGELSDLKSYVKATREYVPFKGTQFKWSKGSREDFPRLSVKVRPELVALGAVGELVVDEKGVVGGGKHLSPKQVNELVEQYGDDVVFFDGRNANEAAVGKFKGAIVPDTDTSHDFISELESGKYDDLKDKKVITYCTGGIRCEVLSVMMKNRGFEDVSQIDGGIVKYGEAYGDTGLWEGSLRVFDDRMTIDFTKHAKVIGECSCCGGPTKNYVDCTLPTCKTLYLLCEQCAADPQNMLHSQECKDAAAELETLRISGR